MADVSGLRTQNRKADPNGYRIGMFSESFHPVQNGVTTSVLVLIKELRRRGHHVCMFAPAHERQPDTESNVLRFPSFVSAFNREYPLAYPFYPRLALETHFERLRMDIVHTHTPFVLGLTGGKLALRRGVPLVSTYHTLYSQYTHYVPLLPDSVTQPLLERYLPWYYNRCAEIICPSQNAARTLTAFGIDRPVQVIPTGVPLPSLETQTEAAKRLARTQIGVAAHTPLMLYAGRLAREKNLEWLLKVFGAVQARVPDARLVIAGDGPQMEELKALAAPFNDRIVFLGNASRRSLDALFAACDVFVFPSPSETQGLVIGEARAAGAPCVVVDAGGAPETVRDGEDGFRVPAGDQQAFTDRIVQLLTDAGLAEAMRRQARQNALLYTPERMVRRVLAVYERARSVKMRPVLHANSSRGDHPFGDLPDALDWEALSQSLAERISDEQ